MNLPQHVEDFIAEVPVLSKRVNLVDDLADKQWADGDARAFRRRDLIAEKHEAEASIARWSREREGVPPNPKENTAPLERAKRRRDKALAAMARLDEEAGPAPGFTTWNDVRTKLVAPLGDIAKRAAAQIVQHEPAAKVTRKALADATKASEALHAERKVVEESVIDRESAEGMLRGRLRTEFPLHAPVTNFKLAHDARLPLLDLKWGPGRAEPAPEDVQAMLLWLANDRIEDELIAQLERRYADLAAKGVRVMTEAERRRELARLNAAIAEAELEEVALMFGLMESEGIVLPPPSRISARAWLGIA